MSHHYFEDEQIHQQPETHPKVRGEQEEMADWKPIETAPKDGTTIFGANNRLAQYGLVHFNILGEWEMVNGLTNMPTGVGFYPTHWIPAPRIEPVWVKTNRAESAET